MQLGLRQATAQVGGEPEVKDRVALTPGEQDGHVELGQPRGHLGQGGEGRVLGGRRDVGDEVGDRAPVAPRCVGPEVGGPDVPADVPMRRGERCPEEERGLPAGQVAESPMTREADQRRHSGRREGDAGVAEQDPPHPLAVLERPAERDRPTPVVRGENDRPLDLERVHDPAEVVDPLRECPRTGALRETHRELVDGEDAVAVAEATVEGTPRE